MELKKFGGRSSNMPLFLLVLLSLSLSYCKIDNDDQEPIIFFYVEDELILDSILLDQAQLLTLTFEVKDNENLNSARCFISKESSFDLNECSLLDDYIFLALEDLKSSNETVQFEINLPDSLNGLYTIQFDAVDESGNLSSVQRLLEIDNLKIPIPSSFTSELTITDCGINLDSTVTEIPIELSASSSELITEIKSYLIFENEVIQDNNFDFTPSNMISISSSLILPEEFFESSILRFSLKSSSGNEKWMEISLDY